MNVSCDLLDIHAVMQQFARCKDMYMQQHEHVTCTCTCMYKSRLRHACAYVRVRACVLVRLHVLCIICHSESMFVQRVAYVACVATTLIE